MFKKVLLVLLVWNYLFKNYQVYILWFLITPLTDINLKPLLIIPNVCFLFVLQILLILETHEKYLVPLIGSTAVITFHKTICISLHDPHLENSLKTTENSWSLLFVSMTSEFANVWEQYLTSLISSHQQNNIQDNGLLLCWSYESSKKKSQRRLLLLFLLALSPKIQL